MNNKPSEYYLTHEEASEIFRPYFKETKQNSYSDDTYYEVPNTPPYRSLAARLPKTNYGWKAYIPAEPRVEASTVGSFQHEASGEPTFTVEYSYNIGD